MCDDRDKRFHDDWRMAFARLKAGGDQLDDLARRGVGAADPAQRADYAALVSKLKTVWKAHYLQPGSQRASSALQIR